MRIDTLRFLLPLLLGSLSAPLPALARVTANVPVDSPYYDTVDKLSAMGYLQSLPNGARPYSWQQLAGWAIEAGNSGRRRNPCPAIWLMNSGLWKRMWHRKWIWLGRDRLGSDPSAPGQRRGRLSSWRWFYLRRPDYGQQLGSFQPEPERT